MNIGKSRSGRQEPPIEPFSVFSPISRSAMFSSAVVIGTPTSTAVPPEGPPNTPERTVGRICSIVCLTPMQSKAKSGPPLVISRTFATGSPCEAFTPIVAPKRRANSSFSSARSTAMIGSAPTTAAAATAESPTPPTPKIATLCFAFTPAVW